MQTDIKGHLVQVKVELDDQTKVAMLLREAFGSEATARCRGVSKLNEQRGMLFRKMIEQHCLALSDHLSLVEVRLIIEDLPECNPITFRYLFAPRNGFQPIAKKIH